MLQIFWGFTRPTESLLRNIALSLHRLTKPDETLILMSDCQESFQFLEMFFNTHSWLTSKAKYPGHIISKSVFQTDYDNTKAVEV